MRKAFCFVLILLLISIGINVWLTLRGRERQETLINRETIIDTVYYREPVAVDSFIVRRVTEVVPVYEGEIRGEKIEQTVRDSVCISGPEIIEFPRVVLSQDSAAIVIPITQKVYEDSTYKAWVSGYHPSLDSIRIYDRREKVIVENLGKVKTKRWHIGPTLGFGYTRRGWEPFAGVSVMYSVWGF